MESKKREQTGQASTEDILGRNVGDSNVDPKWERHYRLLRDQRDAILRRQRDLLNQAAEEVTLPQRNLAEQGTDQYDRDLVLGMASSEQAMLYEIDQALNRIRNGAYGRCEATGQPIEPDRLEAIPWTRFSADAEKKLEADGQTDRARLGERRLVPREPPPRG